ncbi:MAG: XRE family transcriptional regulator [Odoribacter sp.]|nr:XRE family transcriptional regulator [Odoribacter sp.]
MPMKNDDLLVKLGERIVQLRKEKEIRQVDLAIDSEIDDGSLRRIEKGKINPTTKTLAKIAKGLGVEIKDLFDFK